MPLEALGECMDTSEGGTISVNIMQLALWRRTARSAQGIQSIELLGQESSLPTALFTGIQEAPQPSVHSLPGESDLPAVPPLLSMEVRAPLSFQYLSGEEQLGVHRA